MVALGLLLAACPESANTSSVTLYDYVCANGTPEDGGATEENSTRCTRCNTGYKLTQAHTCVMRPYVCENGIPSGDDAPADNITKCQKCIKGYVLTAAETCNYAYVCDNGTPVDDTDATADNITKCQICSTGYVLTAAETCNYAYVCDNGTPVDDTDATADNITKCQRCNNTYKLSNNRCDTRTQYTCTNGTLDTSVSGSPAGNKDVERCQSCTSGYVISSSKVCLLRTATAIATGNTHTCVILDNNGIKCWGRGSNGRLGYDDTNDRTSPPSSTVNLGTGRTATAIEAGTSHTCAILDNGAVKCWGNGSDGRLGYGDTNDRTSPPSSTVNLGTGRTAKAIAAGGAHTCVILDNNGIKCWGRGSNGRLGYGDTNDRTSPPSSTVNLGTNRTAKAIAAGSAHTCVILDNNAIKCWGSGNNGLLGYDSTADHATPLTEFVNLGTGRTATAITTRDSHACALLNNGAVKCWGQGFYGQLGYGNTTAQWSPPASPNNGYVNLGTGRTAAAIEAGTFHTCVILDNGAVKCWGIGNFGQLGYGNTNRQNSPPSASVNLGTGRTATAIVTGRFYSCALLNNGAVKCWGDGDYGQLGYGNTNAHTRPPTSPNNGYINLEGN